MKPIEVIQLEDGLNQIDDVDVYGISLLAGASNDTANITEVAIRCIRNVRGEKWQKKKVTRLMML